MPRILLSARDNDMRDNEISSRSCNFVFLDVCIKILCTFFFPLEVRKIEERMFLMSTKQFNKCRKSYSFQGAGANSSWTLSERRAAPRTPTACQSQTTIKMTARSWAGGPRGDPHMLKKNRKTWHKGSRYHLSTLRKKKRKKRRLAWN